MEQDKSVKRLYDLKSQQTLETIDTLMQQGVDQMSVIIRHSDRHYHRDFRMEPFMGLTRAGKSYAHDMGAAFPAQITPQLYASHFGRCIETAYLIDKGYTRANGIELDHVQTSDVLAPFYIKDIEKALGLMKDQGGKDFIRSWFDKKIATEIMEDPEKTAQILTDFMIECLDALSPGQIAVCASHDWNIFPIKEYKLGLDHEGAGDVGYLDGVVFYRDKGKPYAITYQTDPVAL